MITGPFYPVISFWKRLHSVWEEKKGKEEEEKDVEESMIDGDEVGAGWSS